MLAPPLAPCAGNAENREVAFNGGIVGLLESSMAQHLWNEGFCYKACWALLALAPAYGARAEKEEGEGGGGVYGLC